MPAHDFVRERQPDPQSCGARRWGRISGAQVSEKLLQALGRDAAPGVGHFELQIRPVATQADAHFSPGGREFNGVRHEVRDDLT